MGNWAINISGMGQHHNRRNDKGEWDATSTVFDEKDANRMFQEFVAKLVEVGHNIESATFTYGARDSVVSKWKPYGDHAGEAVTELDNRPDWKKEQDDKASAIAE